MLLEIKQSSKEHIIINDIHEFYKINNIKKPDNKKDWYTLWTSKIDYLEIQLSEFGKKYPLLRKSFPYFCGLAENAIQLLEKINVTDYVRDQAPGSALGNVEVGVDMERDEEQ